MHAPEITLVIRHLQRKRLQAQIAAQHVVVGNATLDRGRGMKSCAHRLRCLLPAVHQGWGSHRIEVVG
jgi:hypothetical protein